MKNGRRRGEDGELIDDTRWEMTDGSTTAIGSKVSCRRTNEHDIQKEREG